MEERSQREGICVYMSLIDFIVQQELTQHCKAIILEKNCPVSMHDTGCLGLVHWDYPEGWFGLGGGRRVQDGEHMYTCCRFIFFFLDSF